MTISDVPLLSAVPKRSLGEANFSTVADTWAASLVTFNTGMNVTIGEINSTAAAMNSIAAGGATAIPYTFSTATGDADPGTGILRLNNATQNLATVIRADLQGSDLVIWTAVLDSFDDSSSTVSGQIQLVKTTDATKWINFNVTAVATPSGYRNITVAVVGSSDSNPFANNDTLVLKFSRTGDKGGTGATGAAGSDGAIVLLSTITASASATVDVETTFDGTYDKYVIKLSGVVPATNATSLFALLKVGGSYATTNYKGSRTSNGTTAATGTTEINMSDARNGTSSGQSANYNVWIDNPASTTLAKVMSWHGLSSRENAGADPFNINGAAGNSALTALTGVRFKFNTGNIASGIFRLYGFSKT